MITSHPRISEGDADGSNHPKSNRRNRMKGIGTRILAELKSFIGIFVYLWVIFGILILHEHAVLSRHGIVYRFYGLAFLNAWILTKIMLIAEHFDTRTAVRSGPLLYPILTRSGLFALLMVCFYALEDMAIGLWRGKTLVDSVPMIGGGGVLGWASVVLIMTVALIPYFTFRELGRVLGPGRLQALLFRDGSHPDLPDQDKAGRG